ncbi:deoxyribose-phosphate aldolase [Falsirhodobacter algicola]|uniref:Deoxyribose-phosphate aldolase n=1 Tax=Falsirhodobacter algicola TaxID=2692330 RepID=A0A8J8MV94_9RHOB|nr:deoxyribose-phosphate aldolase [Falsirhodobacter algicola]QUS37084.1 deoxyribose-phosphate aldolase [Falsirhodobacter algicola]
MDAQMIRDIIRSIDLTDLSPNADEAGILTLCDRAMAEGTAAVCIPAQFLFAAQKRLSGSGVQGATVVNFPGGDAPLEAVLEETRRALDLGAEEVDLVVPYALADAARTRDMVGAVREITGGIILKAILETGRLDPAQIRAQADAAICGGADFLKTSTGMVDVGATPEAAAILLEAIVASEAPVGLKVSGGIRTAEAAAGYLTQARAALGTSEPSRFRIGCSGLLNALTGGRAAQTGY